MSPRLKPAKPLTAEAQSEADREGVMTALRGVIADPKSTTLDRTRAAECMGRMQSYSWFSKPGEPASQDATMDEGTARTLIALADKLLGKCPKCGAQL